MPLIVSVGTGATTLDSIKMNSQQRLFYRNGNYYLFWVNPATYVYYYRISTTIIGLGTASDNLWLDAAAFRGGGWDIYYDSSLDELGIVILEYVSAQSAYVFHFWYCNFNVDNTVNSINLTNYSVYGGSVHDFIHLTRTNTGIWIISSLWGTSTKYHMVFRSTNSSGTGWGNDIVDAQGAANPFSDNITCSRIGVTGNKYVAIGCRHTDKVIYAKYFNGTTVGALISSSFVRSTLSAPSNDPSGWSSPVVDSFGDVHIVVVEETTYDLYHLTFSSSTLLWTSELISSANDYRAPSLAIDASNYLYVIVRASTSFFHFNNNSGAWADRTSLMNADFTAAHDTSSNTPVLCRSAATGLYYAWYSIGIWVDGPGIAITVTPDASLAAYSTLFSDIVISVDVSPDLMIAAYSMLDATVPTKVRLTSSSLEFYVSPYYDIYAGGIPNFLDSDDMPTEWIRKCDGQDYESERELYRNFVTEAYNKFGVCMTYYVVSYDTQYDKIWGEDNDRRFIRKFEFMAFYPLQSEEKMWTKFAMAGIDEFSVFVSKDHFRVASTYGQSTVAGNLGENTYPIYVPKNGDIIQSMFNQYLYEIVTVKEESMMIHLSKRYTWELVVKPYMDEHLSLDADTSASMGTISAFVDVKPDILDVSEQAISAAAANAYVPKICERPSRDPFNGW